MRAARWSSLNRFSSWSGSLSSRSRSSSSSSCRSTSTWLRRARLTNIALTLRRISACSTATLTALRCTATNASASSPISSSERTTAGGTSISGTAPRTARSRSQGVGQLHLRDPQRLAAQQPHGPGDGPADQPARSAGRPAAPATTPPTTSSVSRSWPRAGRRRPGCTASSSTAASTLAQQVLPLLAGRPPLLGAGSTAGAAAPVGRVLLLQSGWPTTNAGSTVRPVVAARSGRRWPPPGTRPARSSCWARRSVRCDLVVQAVPAGAGGGVELAADPRGQLLDPGELDVAQHRVGELRLVVAGRGLGQQVEQRVDGPVVVAEDGVAAEHRRRHRRPDVDDLVVRLQHLGRRRPARRRRRRRAARPPPRRSRHRPGRWRSAAASARRSRRPGRRRRRTRAARASSPAVRSRSCWSSVHQRGDLPADADLLRRSR